jgi:hypothetical protein
MPSASIQRGMPRTARCEKIVMRSIRVVKSPDGRNAAHNTEIPESVPKKINHNATWI